jgi:hypothetical protein
MPSSLPFLRSLIATPNFQAFRVQFEQALSDAAQSTKVRNQLRAVGAEGFEVFIQGSPAPDAEILAWFANHAVLGTIDVTPSLVGVLRRALRLLTQAAERRRHGGVGNNQAVVQLKRVVQFSWYASGSFSASDAFEIRRSIFRSHQERTFAKALSLRFPGLVVLPNYPLDQVADMERLKKLVSDRIWRYGRDCRLDALLVTPMEGDPIAAFELDSHFHDDPEIARRDQWKNDLLATTRIPLFRLRSDDPNATSIDEWYSILTDEVLDKIDCGERIRTREVHTSLVPVYK